MKQHLRSAVFLLVFLSTAGYAQRKLPYPIILVHGWGGSDKSFYPLISEFNRLGLGVAIDPVAGGAGTGSRLDYCLNADGDLTRSYLLTDVADQQSYVNPNYDIFVINFATCDNTSNQSAIVKQGYALGLAIDRVLSATGADKVILFGHSMGGLAIREYYQNKRHWRTTSDRVAQIVTLGTPHLGSNSNSLGLVYYLNSFLEWSEAVRDLRFPEGYSLYDRGVYLYGGREFNMKRLGLYDYYNTDVNCDGDANDVVTGLNQMGWVGDVPFACVVGTRYGLQSDFIVEADRANVNKNFVSTIADVIYADQRDMEAGTPNGIKDTWHTQLLHQKVLCIRALDEPDLSWKAFEVFAGKGYTGFFQTPAPGDGEVMDKDFYKIYLPQRGVFTVAAATLSQARASYTIADYGTIYAQGNFTDGKMNHSMILNKGEYLVRFTGYAGTGVHAWTSYNHAHGFCPLPEVPTLTANAPTTFCEGGTTTITATDGYEEYRWSRNGVRLPDASRTLTARQGGTYTVEASKCGIVSASTNSVTVQVKPVPAVPTISLDPVTGQLTSSSATGNQWLLNGTALTGATAQQLPKVALGAGSYTVQVNLDGCQSTSAPFMVTGVEPTASAVAISPNPATGYVTISGFSGQSTVTLSLWNTLGKIVRKVNVPAGKTSQELPLHELAPGVYLIKLEGEGQTYSSKLVVF